MSKMNSVVPEKHSLETKFNFRCHKGIQCFTKCCSNIEILLTPYDVVRLKKRLGLFSDEFLDEYTHMKIDEKTSHPNAILNMSDDKERKCIFLNDDGCSVYSDRPANCRYYPVGQGTIKKEVSDEIVEEDFYFFVKEPHCLGFNEKKAWTIESWREDQDAALYDKVNKEWKGLMLRKNLPNEAELDEKKQFQFYMASYDLDRFKKYIFESEFLNIFDIDDDLVAKIREDEVELIKFGVRYIKYVMMLEETLTLKPDAEKFKTKK